MTSAPQTLTPARRTLRPGRDAAGHVARANGARPTAGVTGGDRVSHAAQSGASVSRQDCGGQVARVLSGARRMGGETTHNAKSFTPALILSTRFVSPSAARHAAKVAPMPNVKSFTLTAALMTAANFARAALPVLTAKGPVSGNAEGVALNALKGATDAKALTVTMPGGEVLKAENADALNAFTEHAARFLTRALTGEVARAANAPEAKDVAAPVMALARALADTGALPADMLFAFAGIGMAACEERGELSLILKLTRQEYVATKSSEGYRAKTYFVKVTPCTFSADGNGHVYMSDTRAFKAATDAGLWDAKRDAALRAYERNGWADLNKAKRKVLMACGWDADGNAPARTMPNAAD